MRSTLLKIVLWLLALCLAVYAGLCGYMFAQQREMLFRPALTQVAAESTDFSLQRPDALLRGWQLHPPQGPVRSAVIYFGGNAENIALRREQLALSLPQSDVYMLAYRGYGASEGSPSQAALEQDGVALFDEVRRLHPQLPITVIGRSLGTGVASAVAHARQPEQLVLITPFDSILNTARSMFDWLPVALLLRDPFDSVAHLRHYRGPILVLRAGRDQVVLPERTDALLRSLNGRASAVRVQDFAQANHSTIFSAQDFWAAITQFVSRHEKEA